MVSRKNYFQPANDVQSSEVFYHGGSCKNWMVGDDC